MLTLYVLTCDNLGNHRPNDAIDSFGDIVSHSYILNHRALSNSIREWGVDTEWYGYIFSDEIIDPAVRDALPIFLKQKVFDSLVLMKKEGLVGDERISQAPRIFHNTVLLGADSFLPHNASDCVFERLLDGWVLPNAKNTI